MTVLDLDVEQVRHPQVLGPRHALQRAEDGGRLRAAEDVAQRQAAGHRVRVRVVVQQDQHAVRVAKYRWYCWTRARVSDRLTSVTSGPPNSSARDRYDTSGNAARTSSSPPRRRVPSCRGRRPACRRRRGSPRASSEAAAPAVLDDDAGVGREVGLEVGVGALRVASRDARGRPRAAVARAACSRRGTRRSKLGRSAVSSSLTTSSSGRRPGTSSVPAAHPAGDRSWASISANRSLYDRRPGIG